MVFIGLIIAAWAIQSLPDIGSLNINNWNIFKDWAHNPLKVVLSPIPGYEGYFICFLVLIITFVTTIFIHTFSITTSYLRITRIENYYNSFIITPDEVDQYKKKVNRRNAIIFAVVVLVVGLIVYFAYKKVKANKEKAAQVITISK
ncbi:MAG: hypothetical protein LBS95_02715 [Mycoplasmataceae bacterium]|nr:hypothetical protein [Mycoplasmataceae bacterium]